MNTRGFGRLAALAGAAALLTAAGPAAAQSLTEEIVARSMTDPYGPHSYIYSPGFYGPGGVLNYPGYYGPGYVGSLWYWPNVHWPSRSWYMTYNAGPGGYRVFYPYGNDNSYYFSLREGVQPWQSVQAGAASDRLGWQFPRDAIPGSGYKDLVEEGGEGPGAIARLQDPTTALIVVRVPTPDAELWIEGEKLVRKGLERRFLSPSLMPRRDYAYIIRVRWQQDGKVQELSRRIVVRAGGTYNVDLSGR